jgi:hypothetical protein
LTRIIIIIIIMHLLNKKNSIMNNKKTMIGLVAGIGIMLMLSIFPQMSGKADPSGPGMACSWGFLWVETSFWPWKNNITSKLCDCTEVDFKEEGNHKRCTPTTW